MSHTQWRKRSGSKFFPGNYYPCFPTPPLYWLVIQRVNRGNLADQLRLLQFPQPGAHQHRPHTEDAVTPTNSLHQGDRPASLANPTGTRRAHTPHPTTSDWAETPTQQHSWRSSRPPWWRTADRTMDARKNIEKSGSSLYARQPHLASTYGSKNSLTPPTLPPDKTLKWGVPNTLNPVCGISTICHQVRCMHWGHFSLFQRDMFLLNWYKIVCMEYLSYAFIQMKFTNVLSVCFKSGVPRHFHWRSIVVLNIISHCSFVCVYQWCPQPLAEIYRNMGICDVSGQLHWAHVLKAITIRWSHFQSAIYKPLKLCLIFWCGLP